MISTLLVVDDSKSSRKMNLMFIQELLGNDVIRLEAASGEAALEILAKQPVDLVLLDLTMPGIGGYGVLKELQRMEHKPTVIVVSADVQRQTRERVTALGAAGFIEKPLNIDMLGETLKALGVFRG